LAFAGDAKVPVLGKLLAGTVPAMGYKILGFTVWKGGRRYVARRLRAARGNLALAGASAAVVTGLLAAQRQRASR